MREAGGAEKLQKCDGQGFLESVGGFYANFLGGLRVGSMPTQCGM